MTNIRKIVCNKFLYNFFLLSDETKNNIEKFNIAIYLCFYYTQHLFQLVPHIFIFSSISLFSFHISFVFLSCPPRTKLFLSPLKYRRGGFISCKYNIRPRNRNQKLLDSRVALCVVNYRSFAVPFSRCNKGNDHNIQIRRQLDRFYLFDCCILANSKYHSCKIYLEKSVLLLHNSLGDKLR